MIEASKDTPMPPKEIDMQPTSPGHLDRSLDLASRFDRDTIDFVDPLDRETAGVASDMAPDLVRDVLLPHGLLASTECLDVYHHMFVASVERLLAERLPAVRDAVGEELFGALACDYVLTYPADTHDLARAGESFPEYLAATRFVEPDRRAWIAELARFERAIARAATGVDRAVDGARWRPAPGLQLLAFRHAIDAAYSAWQLGGSPVLPLRRSQWIAVYRQGSQVQRAPMTRRAWHVLSALCDGRPFAAAISEPFGPRGRASVLRRADRWMQAWISNGILFLVQAS